MTTDEGARAALADVRSIHAWASDSVLVLDGLDPFLRVYGRGGVLKSALVPQGEGPGELVRPSMMALFDRQFWILNRNGIGIFDATTLQEIGRTAALVGMVAMYEGCAGRPTVLFSGTVPDAPNERAHGVAVHDGHEWIERTDLRRSTLTPTWPDFRVVRLTDTTFVYFDWEQSMLRAINCDGRTVGGAVVEYPKEWRTTPRPHGLSTVGPWVVLFYSDRPARTQDTTWVTLWRPDTGETTATATRRMAGDWRLLGAGGGSVWVLDNRSVPTVFGTPERRFLRWLGLGP